MKATELLTQIHDLHYKEGQPDYAAIVPLIRVNKTALGGNSRYIDIIDAKVRKHETEEPMDGQAIYDLETAVLQAAAVIHMGHLPLDYYPLKTILEMAGAYLPKTWMKGITRKAESRFTAHEEEGKSQHRIIRLYWEGIQSTNPTMFISRLLISDDQRNADNSHN